ncbi:MAG: hypothetical protein LBR20_05560 [Propionibacteriaceae bacterium]|jgi:hypothetical protein|nr:hypothetical protein [Propionibacteriaceae bacterium]
MDGLNSNLDLNEGLVPRVMPNIGEWGPQQVPSTKSKRRARWLTITAFVVILAAVIAYGYWMYTLMR